MCVYVLHKLAQCVAMYIYVACIAQVTALSNIIAKLLILPSNNINIMFWISNKSRNNDYGKRTLPN